MSKTGRFFMLCCTALFVMVSWDLWYSSLDPLERSTLSDVLMAINTRLREDTPFETLPDSQVTVALDEVMSEEAKYQALADQQLAGSLEQAQVLMGVEQMRTQRQALLLEQRIREFTSRRVLDYPVVSSFLSWAGLLAGLVVAFAAYGSFKKWRARPRLVSVIPVYREEDRVRQDVAMPFELEVPQDLQAVQARLKAPPPPAPVTPPVPASTPSAVSRTVDAVATAITGGNRPELTPAVAALTSSERRAREPIPPGWT